LKSVWLKRIGIALAAIAALFAVTVAVLDSQFGHRLVADAIADMRPKNGLRYSVGRIEGSLFGQATLRDVRVADPKGVFLTIPRIELDWRPLRWLSNRLEIKSAVAPQATLIRTPQTTPTGKQGPILPDFDIAIGRLEVQRLTVGRAVTGVVRGGRILGRADIRAGRALIDLGVVVEGSDRLQLKLDAAPDNGRFDIDLHARGIASGVLARLSGLRRPLAIDVAGDGDWQAWRGRATVDSGAARLADLALANKAGRYTLSGAITPNDVLGGVGGRLLAGRLNVMGQSTFANRRLDGSLSLRSAAIDGRVEGQVDLADNAWRNVRFDLRLLRPPALLADLTGRNIAARAILDGAFTAPSFDYRITADRAAIKNDTLEQLRIAGRGRLTKQPWQIPVQLTAARYLGSGDVATRLLRNLSITGVLRVTPKLIVGDALKVRSDQLVSTLDVTIDLARGTFEVGLNGRIGKYLIPGLGLFDIQSRLRVVPNPGGGTRLVGTATVQTLRLDNAFFRGLTGGLPRLTADILRGPDRILRLGNLRLTSPRLKFAGAGYRRVDGSFHIEGSGTQASYGPFRLTLDGKIERPNIDLLLLRPNDTAGLSNVRVKLTPDGPNFNFQAAGGSRLGPFTARGAILLPRGADGSIRIDALDVSGTRASGTLRIVSGGLDGRLAIDGGGLSGELLLGMAGTVQRVEGHIVAANAKLGSAGSVRRGRLDFVAMLVPGAPTVDATATATAFRSGAITLARFAGNLKMTGGNGELRASLAGSRGRSFEIQTVTQIAPDRFSIVAQGTVDRRPLRLLAPAVVTREGGGWRLAPTRLSFAGGEANVGGVFGGDRIAVEGGVTRMPLTILDILFPGAGLGGNATGTFAYADTAGGAPTGRADLTVRGLSRAGLVLSSKPIDMGVAAVLSANQLGLRAVMESEGKTIGRAQMRLSPLTGGDLAGRLKNAPLFGQIRYSGPADTLWRLTGVELFDLSGPIAVAADVTGRLADPQIRGQLVANGARIESARTGTVLTNVQAAGRFNGSRLEIGRFTAAAGAGTISGSGTVGFAGGVNIDLKLDAQNARMIDRDDLGATITGPLTIKSDASGGGTIAGDVRLVASRFRLGAASAATAVPRLNIREINVPDDGRADDDRPAGPWQLDLHARASDSVRVSGLGLDSNWSADLTIKGEPNNPAIRGRADLIRGTFEFAGRDFDLDRGIIRFDGSVPANPSLDISANASVTGLNATIRVTGTGQKPEISFTSVPALPQDELLSRLLFGTSITNLSAPEALQLAAAVAALNDRSGNGGLNPINAVRRAIGLDRLRVLPADPQTGAGTQVAAGKYITRRLYAEIVTDGQGYSATRLEFQVTRWLSLLSTISTIGRQSANVRVSKDY
jgi:translocation and assembly module TamB